VATVDPAKAERRRQIVASAKHVFAEVGYHTASINAIIEACQIARGTFYWHFESKAAVFDCILDEAMVELRARIRRIEVTPEAPPPQVQLREQVVGTLRYILSDRDLAVLLLAAERTPDAEAAERLDQFFGEVRGLIERAIELGMEIGLVRRCRPELVAAAMLGMIRGVIQLVVTQHEPLPVEDLAAELLMVALRGVLA
jgi:AcrR family transcriptional regulator